MAASSQPIIKTHYVGELVCHLCGRPAGTITTEDRTLPPSVSFTQAGARAAVTVLDWRRLRCAHCGGAVLVDSLEEIRRRIEPSNAFAEERPRRGRPPKWLVEQREREREQLEEQLARERDARAA